MTERDDLELLQAWRSGDDRAGSELFGRYFEAMYRFFRSKLENNVEDMVQQTFLACVRNRDDFRGDSSFRTYLYKIAKTKLYDALRGRPHSNKEVSLCTMADFRTSPSAWVAHQQELQLLHDALDRLPLEMQLAVELFYFEDLSAREVAAALELPEGTVRSRIRRAIEALRADIQVRAVESEPRLRTLDTLNALLAAKAGALLEP
jgi:RNA polymerase sigma factor (sigma-70 family)